MGCSVYWRSLSRLMLTPAPADDHFLAALAAQNIPGDRGQLIADGHAACDGYGTPGMTGLMLQIMGLGMSKKAAKDVGREDLSA